MPRNPHKLQSTRNLHFTSQIYENTAVLTNKYIFYYINNNKALQIHTHQLPGIYVESF